MSGYLQEIYLDSCQLFFFHYGQGSNDSDLRQNLTDSYTTEMTYRSTTELCISFSVDILKNLKIPTTRLYVVLLVKGEMQQGIYCVVTMQA